MAVTERDAKLTDQTKAFLAESKKLFIGGKWVDAADGRTFGSMDPATDTELTQVPQGGAEDVDRAVAAARDAFEDGRWSTIDPRARAKVLFKLADLIEQNIASIAQVDVLDNGKPAAFAFGEVAHAISVYRYFAGMADKLYGETHQTDADNFIYTLREPMGVCAQVIPWNFPSAMVSWKIAPALAFGNTVVLKPAEETPLSALWIGKLAQEAGLPDGVLNILTGDAETGAPLVRHTGVDKIAFTGSTEVGRKILESSANNLARVTLELGGKSPNIVFPDADLSKAIPQSIFGIFFNSGQMCSAGSRLLVQRDVHDELIEGFKQAAAGWKVGNGLDDGVLIGPLVSKQQLDRVSGYLDVGPSEGAEVVIGGARVKGSDGYFVEPTIFDAVKPDMRIAREEIFGPVLSVLSFDDVDEAIRIGNDTMYGLAAGVWTRDVSVAHKVTRGLRAGTVWVNMYGMNDPGVGFGGYKASGFGRELGIHAAQSYTQTKSVWMRL